MMTVSQKRSLIIFPAIAIAFSASCAAAGSAAGTTSAPPPAAVGSTASAATSAGAPKATASSQLALDVLATIPVRKEQPAGYLRSKFRHWVDADGDSCNTREEILIAESTSPAQVDPFGCKVIAGDWYSPYDDRKVTDPSELDIDHFVALKEAWDSGAGRWSASRRQSFANDMSDPRSLIAVTASSNRSKGEKDPPQWMPRNKAIHCSYLSDWVANKAQWGLSMDESEYRFIEKRLKGTCAGTTLAPWGSAVAAPGTPAAPATTAPAQPSVTTAPVSSTPDTTAAKGSALPTVKPGAFCSPKGAQGTYSGATYVCATNKTDGTPYSDGRARWRKA